MGLTRHDSRALQQRGMTLIGFMVLLALVLFFVYIGIKIVPIYLNHFSVMNEVKAIAEKPGSAQLPLTSLRRDLITRLQVSYVEHIKPEHIKVLRGPPPALVVEYEVQEHLIGNIDIIVKFNSVEQLRN